MTETSGLSKNLPHQSADISFDNLCRIRSLFLSFITYFAFSADFSECDLRYAEFLGINLSEKTFHRSTLTATRFTNCKLCGSNFSESSFKDAIFYNCNLQDATFTEVKHLFINPMENKIKNTSIDILAAGNIVNHFGFNIDWLYPNSE